MIRLSKYDYKTLISYAKYKLPNESCGLIAGFLENDVSIIKKIYFLTNIDGSDKHFSLEPKEQFAAIKDMRANGLLLLGNWHSHPKAPPIPSDEDRQLAYDSKASYMILSLMNGENPILNSFRIIGVKFKKEELIIE